ncbi:MAG TPA: CBS domain-containing protein [Rhodocyclaceae bacterium]|nr:CBS domain-containing protein [Rhodocyclaceae bacterium]
MDTDLPGVAGTESEDHFLRLMFFQPGHRRDYGSGGLEPAGLLRFEPLPEARLQAAEYCLPDRELTPPLRVHAGSPAIDVMTDLHRVPPVTIGRLATIEDANRTMKSRSVRSLFVVDRGRVVGMITASDILGEKPLQVGHELGVRHDEVIVRDVMTPAEQMKVISFRDVAGASVGNVVATLKRAGRQHALVTEAGESGARQFLRGIFSLTQIARQLGVSPVVPDVARCIADIEVAFAGN